MNYRILLVTAFFIVGYEPANAQSTPAEVVDLLTGGSERQWVGVHTVRKLGSGCNDNDVSYTFHASPNRVVSERCVSGVKVSSKAEPFTIQIEETPTKVASVRFGGKTWIVVRMPKDAQECNGYEECVRISNRDANTGVVTYIYLAL